MENAAQMVELGSYIKIKIKRPRQDSVDGAHTLNGLRLENIVDHVFDPRRGKCIVDTMRKLLENNPPGKLRVFSFELGALVTNPSSHINEDGKLRIPPLGLFLDWVH